MAYVDLNPVRAGMVESLDEPQLTGAHDRIEAMTARERLSRLAQRSLQGGWASILSLAGPPWSCHVHSR